MLRKHFDQSADSSSSVRSQEARESDFILRKKYFMSSSATTAMYRLFVLYNTFEAKITAL